MGSARFRVLFGEPLKAATFLEGKDKGGHRGSKRREEPARTKRGDLKKRGVYSGRVLNS